MWSKDSFSHNAPFCPNIILIFVAENDFQEWSIRETSKPGKGVTIACT